MNQADGSQADTRTVYRIVVVGHLDPAWTAWLDGLRVAHETADAGSATSTLTGPIVDQSALRGLLAKLWNLNLVVLSVARLDEGHCVPEG